MPDNIVKITSRQATQIYSCMNAWLQDYSNESNYVYINARKVCNTKPVEIVDVNEQWTQGTVENKIQKKIKDFKKH